MNASGTQGYTVTINPAVSITTTALAKLMRRASDNGVTAPKLVADLLEVITQDNLYEAVLDREPA